MGCTPPFALLSTREEGFQSPRLHLEARGGRKQAVSEQWDIPLSPPQIAPPPPPPHTLPPET